MGVVTSVPVFLQWIKSSTKQLCISCIYKASTWPRCMHHICDSCTLKGQKFTAGISVDTDHMLFRHLAVFFLDSCGCNINNVTLMEIFAQRDVRV